MADNLQKWNEVATHAWQIKKALDQIELAKMNAERAKIGLEPIRPWFKELCARSGAFCWAFISKTLCPCIFQVNLKQCNKNFWQSTRGQALMRIIGFSSGIFLSFSVFFGLARFINFPVRWAGVIGIILSKLLCFGLAFNHSVRVCTVITLPNLTSRACRITILMYTVWLVYQHPMANFQNNVHVLIDSIVCVEQTVVRLVREAIKNAMSPLRGRIVDMLYKTASRVLTADNVATWISCLLDCVCEGEIGNSHGFLEKLKGFANMIRLGFLRYKVIIQQIVAAIKRAYQWYVDMVLHCNQTLGGNPYRKCSDTMNTAFNKCWDLHLTILCYPIKVIQLLCVVVKVMQVFCIITTFAKTMVNEVLQNNLGFTLDDIISIFFFGIRIEYKYIYKMTQSRSHASIARDIFRHMRRRLQVLSFARYSVGFIIFQIASTIAFETWNYHYRFYRDDSFDNYYITNLVQTIDDKRKDKNLPSIMPLSKWEETFYIAAGNDRSFFFLYLVTLISSEIIILLFVGIISVTASATIKVTTLAKPKLSKPEILKFIVGVVVWMAFALYDVFFVGLDVSFYGILLFIKSIGSFKTVNLLPSFMKIDVQGTGVMADLYRALISKFTQVTKSPVMTEFQKCLPEPRPPNYYSYQLIGTMLLLTFVLAVCDTYILRTRHCLLEMFYPERKRPRAAWLYNHILRRRGTTLRQMFHYVQDLVNRTSNPSVMFDLIADRIYICHVLMTRCCGWRPLQHCYLCAIVVPKNMDTDQAKFVRCTSYSCPAIYCKKCYADLNNVCAVCHRLVSYDDVDISPASDSSEDEEIDIRTPIRMAVVRRLTDRARAVQENEEAKRHAQQTVTVLRRLMALRNVQNARFAHQRALRQWYRRSVMLTRIRHIQHERRRRWMNVMRARRSQMLDHEKAIRRARDGMGGRVKDERGPVAPRPHGPPRYITGVPSRHNGAARFRPFRWRSRYPFGGYQMRPHRSSVIEAPPTPFQTVLNPIYGMRYPYDRVIPWNVPPYDQGHLDLSGKGASFRPPPPVFPTHQRSTTPEFDRNDSDAGTRSRDPLLPLYHTRHPAGGTLGGNNNNAMSAADRSVNSDQRIVPSPARQRTQFIPRLAQPSPPPSNQSFTLLSAPLRHPIPMHHLDSASYRLHAPHAYPTSRHDSILFQSQLNESIVNVSTRSNHIRPRSPPPLLDSTVESHSRPPLRKRSSLDNPDYGSSFVAVDDVNR